MRASQWLLGLATTAATVACVASGCGGSTSGGAAPDSGAADVTTDHVEASVMEAAPEAAQEASVDAACMNDVIITSIPIPDGSVPGSDASAATCLQCVETDCPNLITQCNATCGCPQAFIAFEQCVGTTDAGLVACAELDLLGAGLSAGDFLCAGPCANTCGVTLDGGKAESGADTSTDSPGDAPTE